MASSVFLGNQLLHCGAAFDGLAKGATHGFVVVDAHTAGNGCCGMNEDVGDQAQVVQSVLGQCTARDRMLYG